MSTPVARSGQLARSATWLLSGHIVSKAGTLVAIVLLARYLEPVYFGQFAVALAIAASLEAIADLGVSQAVVREGAGRPDRLRRLVASLAWPKLTLAAALPLTSWATAVLLGLPSDVVEATLWLGIARGLDSLTTFARAVFQAREQMAYDAASLTADSFVRVAFAGYAIASGFGTVGIAKAMALAALVVLLGTAVVCVKLTGLRPGRPDLGLALSAIGMGLPFAAAWLLDSLVLRIGIVVAAAEPGAAAAGRFAAAARLAEPTLIIPAMVGAALLPLTSRHLLEGVIPAARVLTASLKVSILAMGGVAVVAFASAPLIVDVLFGPAFAGSILVLRVLSISLLLSATRVVLTYGLLAVRRGPELVGAQAIGCVVNVVAAIALVHALSEVGLAVAVLLAEVGTVIVLLRMSGEVAAEATRSLLLVAAALAACVVASAIGGLAGAISGIVLGGLVLTLVSAPRSLTAREVDYLVTAAPFLMVITRTPAFRGRS